MGKRILFASVALVLIGLITYSFFNAYGDKPVQLQGQVEARQIMVSSKIPGRLAEVYVRRGEQVEAGEPVFRIDSPELEARLLQVEALERITRALSDAIEGGTREEKLRAAQSEYEKAQAHEALARTTYERIQSLAEQGVVSRQRLDESFTLLRLAEQTRVTAKAILDLAEAGPREEAREAGRAGDEAMLSLRDELMELMDDTTMTAHLSGVVSNVLLTAGELVPQGFPVVMIMDMDDAWVVVNVREDMLRYFADGTTFDVFIPALDQHAAFAVEYVSVLGDYATWRATVPGRGFDMRTFEVELRPVSPVQGLRAGMSVLLDIDTRKPDNT